MFDRENHSGASSSAHPLLPACETGNRGNSDAEPFDYSRVPEEHRAATKNAAHSIRGRIQKQAKDAFFFGQELSQIKNLLEHGLFLEWIEKELGINARTAERLMQISARLGGKIDKLSHLPVSTLYQITARSTPDQVIDECIERASAAELSSIGALQIVRKAKAQPSQRRVPLIENDALDLLIALIGCHRDELASMLTKEKTKAIAEYLEGLRCGSRRTTSED